MVVEIFAPAQFHSFLSRLWNDGQENYLLLSSLPASQRSTCD